MRDESPKCVKMRLRPAQWRKLGAKFGADEKFFLPSPLIEKYEGTAGDSLYRGTKCWQNGNLLATAWYSCTVRYFIIAGLL